MISLEVDGVKIQACKGDTILEAAQKASIYIPSLCYHPDLPPFSTTKPDETVFRGKCFPVMGSVDIAPRSCDLCLVEVEGQPDLVRACETYVNEGMKVATLTERVQEARREKLALILAKHPHTCLTCAQREGCSREPCSLNVPLEERCCDKFGNCQLEKVAEYIGIREDTPRYTPAKLPIVRENPLFVFDYNLCIGCTRCVRACQDLRGAHALGLTCKNEEVLVGTRAPMLKDSGCRFCGACVEICPTGALHDKDPKAADGEKSVIPCVAACPAGVDIPSYVRFIAEGKFDMAAAVIREKVPFPRVLGYVCHHPCESSCRRSELNESISICALKRSAVENGTDQWKAKIEKASLTKKKVAIIGSGPAGLTVAYYLAMKGHSVTVLEALPELGGMLRMGILRCRLPREVLQKDINEILELGVEAKMNFKIGPPSAFDALKRNYDVVFIGVGTQKSRELSIEGLELKGVWFGLDILREANFGRKVEVGSRVLVVGGGNVAIDVARASVRLGAKTSILYRRSRGEMPAEPDEVRHAEEEGVDFQFLLAPSEILGRDGHVAGIKCIRMRLGEPDESGRRRPIPVEDEEIVIETDNVIVAIGETPDLSFLPENVEVTKEGTLKVDSSTMETAIPRVFAGGDVTSGPSSVIHAIDMGRKAAASIDKLLGGDGNIDESLVDKERSSAWLGREENFADKTRVTMPYLTIEERCTNFSLIELGYSQKEAIEEAKRCLQCDLRLQIKAPPLPPEKWLKLDASTVDNVPETDGVYQLLNENNEAIYIKGTLNLRKDLQEQLTTNPEAKRFLYEEAKMFTARESELLQQFLKKHGRLPRQNVDIDDLY